MYIKTSVVALAAFLLVPSFALAAAVPAPTRIINVSPSQLTGALGNALAGDHIILANGTYGGFTVSRSGTAAKPIVIRAANTLGAKVSGNVTISGNYAYVIGLDFTNGSRAVVNGTGDRISRSRFRSNGKSIVLNNSARGAIIDHNEIDSQALPDSSVWSGIHVSVNASGVNHHIHRNYIHGAPPGNGNTGTSAIYLATTDARRYAANILIEYNLFADWHGDAETVSAKTSGNTIQFNTVLNSENLTNRMGTNNKWIANWLENSGKIAIYDRDNTAIGNRATVWLGAGNAVPLPVGQNQPKIDNKDPRNAATNSIVAGNTGELRIGHPFGVQASPETDTFPAVNTKVEAHNTGNACGAGSITCYRHNGTTFSAFTSRPVPNAFKLTTLEVGPNATTAPKW